MSSSQRNVLMEEDTSEGMIHPDGLANDLIKGVFKNYPERGLHEESSFSVSSGSLPKCKSKIDSRLDYWKNMLIQRRALQERLRVQLGRTPEDMILNQQGKIVKRSIGGCLETVGLPSYSAAEILGCKELKMEEADITPELPPQIRSLEVVGRKIQTHCSKTADLVGCTEPLGASDAVEVAQSTVTIQQPVSGLGVRINGINFWPHNPEFSPTIDRTFACQPFQRHLRPIIRIENIGSQELSLKWKKVNFFSNNNTLMEADPDDFVFDVAPFVLLPGEFRDVTVLYQPRCVAIVKQRWLLSTCPRIFFCRPSGFTLNLNGRCTPPKEYLDRLKMEKLQVLSYAPPPPLQQQTVTLCPYERELEEREVFNRRNRSFQCLTHQDFERLMAFYKRVRPPNSHVSSWDYSVHSLIHLVCNSRDIRQRIKHSSELANLLDGLRRTCPMPLVKADSVNRLRNRNQSKMIYVRGILGSLLEEWEQRVQFLRSRVAHEDSSSSLREANSILRSKSFMDSICMQLHGLICRAVEDIVSVIESTVQI
ncbi:uncharacterized protein LOC27206149 [Drosophila simulans]|uniref:Uncharacterized protein n=2 Tax=Drosophila simulans TaxID=7240 RepID=A0A0J9R710_DROSI|nr:uncharacterized protein LOC27206149 [Drosophila simulans]KMY91932.1 uncharacterized protein Dsimw501_GD10463 [Drosophila simulans]